MNLAEKSRVVLRPGLPPNLRRFAECEGVVTAFDPAQGAAEVDFGGERVGVMVRYLAPAPTGEKRKRRGVLNLRAPKDERTEAERLDDGAKDIEQLGYRVWRVGQGKAVAICHRCSRISRERGGKPMVQIRCRDCGSLGYAPSTHSTMGVPDTFILCPRRWPRRTVLPVEWKDDKNGKRTEEQAELEAAGVIVVVWNSETLFAAVAEFERADPRIEPNPAIVEWLERRGVSPGKLSGAE